MRFRSRQRVSGGGGREVQRSVHVRVSGRCAVALVAAVAGVIGAFAQPSPASAASSAAWQITLAGRGYGHGIGMSQYGAQGYALQGASYRKILQSYYQGIGFGTVTNRNVRVLLTSGQSSVSVTCSAAYSGVVGGQTVSLAGGSTASVTWTGAAFRLACAGQTWTAAQPIVFRPTSTPLMLVNKSGALNAAGAAYRGTLTVVHETAGLSAINTLPLESYLRGVVPLEMPSSWSLEALKAQAVAARTYAVRAIGGGLFDLYSDTRSQAYGGAGRETAATNAAVSGSAGVIATYSGQPIAAFYFSTSGGHTENIENVWSTAAQPYLKGVADPYDAISPYHTWPDNPLRKTAANVSAALGSGDRPAGQLQALYVVKRGVSRRVVHALALSDAGATRLSGDTVRTRLGLRSTWFDARSMSISPGDGGSITAGQSLTLSGTTYPALAASTTVSLFSYRDGRWSSVAVPADAVEKGVRKVSVAGTTYSCSFTTYRYTVTPTATTRYYFAASSGRSPEVTVAVGPGVSPSAEPSPSPSAQPTASPSVQPSPSPSASPTPPAEPSGGPSFFTEATRRFRVARWGTAALRWRVVCENAPPGAKARVVIRIRRLSDGRSVKTILLDGRPLNVTSYTRFRCGLAPGVYGYYVHAQIAGAGRQTRVGENQFTVR